MSRGKKKNRVSPWMSLIYDVQSTKDLTEEQRQSLLSGAAAQSIYAAENDGKRPEFGNITPGVPGSEAMNRTFEGLGDQAAVKYQEYFMKAYEKIKKDKQSAKDRIKLLTEQPGLSAQTRGQTALAIAGGAQPQGSSALSPRGYGGTGR